MKVRRGEHIGKVPYGYNRENQKLVINEEEAKAVQMMYKWYLEGWGYKKITNELNQLGIKSKTKNWQMTSVQRILQNPIYKGTFILNQYTSVKVGGKKNKFEIQKKNGLFFLTITLGLLKKRYGIRQIEKNKKIKRKSQLGMNFAI